MLFHVFSYERGVMWEVDEKTHLSWRDDTEVLSIINMVSLNSVYALEKWWLFGTQNLSDDTKNYCATQNIYVIFFVAKVGISIGAFKVCRYIKLMLTMNAISIFKSLRDAKSGKDEMGFEKKNVSFGAIHGFDSGWIEKVSR